MSMGACSPSADGVSSALPLHSIPPHGLVGCTGDSQWKVVASEISSVHLPQPVGLPTESSLVCPCWSRGMTGRLPCHLMPSKKGCGHHDLWLSSSSLATLLLLLLVHVGNSGNLSVRLPIVVVHLLLRLLRLPQGFSWLGARDGTTCNVSKSSAETRSRCDICRRRAAACCAKFCPCCWFLSPSCITTGHRPAWPRLLALRTAGARR